MKSPLLRFIAMLIASSAILFVLWLWRGEAAYARAFGSLLRLLGFDTAAMRDAVPIVTPRLYNIIPLLSLMVAAWGITMRRRLWGMLIGFLLLATWHLVFLQLVHSIVSTHGLGPGAYRRLSPLFLFSDVLPWLLWAVVCRRPLADLIPPRRVAPDKGGTVGP